MHPFRKLRQLIHELRHGWISVPLFYLVLCAVAYGAYYYLSHLPAKGVVPSPSELWAIQGSLISALASVWLIFAWGFGIQLAIQIWRTVKRHQRDANLPTLIKHGVWMSANAGLFEEVIFRLYAFLAMAIGLQQLNALLDGALAELAQKALLPAVNWLSFGIFAPTLVEGDWAVGVSLIVGGLFFSSAHIHYGRLSKLNVWVIGMVMFWLVFNYGLLAAIVAHFLYDLSVFIAIALSSPFQPKAEHEA